VADVLEAEIVVLALGTVALRRAIDARFLAAFPGAGLGLGTLFGSLVAGLDADAIEQLGIQFHNP
jgi:hypothetical protein